MIILGIETSCDETAVCLLETIMEETGLKYRVLGSFIHSQIALHKEYGGVFPMMAKRAHAENIVPLTLKLIETSGIKTANVEATISTEHLSEKLSAVLVREHDLEQRLRASDLMTIRPAIDAIAVTEGPGLEPALWVGINFAQALGLLWNVPVYPENHMEGHIVSTLIDHTPTQEWKKIVPIAYPALAVLLSGGHTELVEMERMGKYTIVGQTRDDAVGEAFDKVARMLGLAYPGGPEVSRRAARARAAHLPRVLTLPRPMLHSGDLDFSFSGLKTAVLYGIKSATLTEDYIDAVCQEFEDAVTEVIEKKTRSALERFSPNTPQTLIIGGGVIANTTLRAMFERLAAEYSLVLHIPTSHLSGDNALMIALAGSIHAHQHNTPRIMDTIGTPPTIKAHGNMRLGTIK